MDPYLEDERLWPWFQHALVTCLYQKLVQVLNDRYRAHVGERRYTVAEAPPGPAISGDQREHYIEIRQRSDGKLVTLVEVVSPANKTTAAGRDAYVSKRSECKVGGNSFVEIDLVLQGQPMLEYSREGLPAWDYAVTVTRAAQPERHEIYTATLQKRLPRFRLPLAADDRDTVMDLQDDFSRCYDQGVFGTKIDYTREPSVPLTEENRRWIDELLLANKLRLPHEQVATAAYYLWQEEGCPDGRDQVHWYRAQARLLNPPQW
jgi:hypothetical protein